MQVLLTGHAGYIGGVLADQLAAAGHDVVGFDHSADPAQDIRDADRVRSLFSDHEFDLVYHLAAEADVWVDDWQYLFENNVAGTVNVVAAARDAGVPVVFGSSVAATGEFNRYGRSKDLAEQAVSEYEQVTTVRFPNVVGLDAPRGQAQDMIEEGLAGEIEVWGNGEIRRSYVDVADLCSTLIELGTGSLTVETPTPISGRTTTNRELGELIQAVVEAETGSEPDLSLVDRSPPSPQSLTARGLRLQDPTPLKESIRSQVRATRDE
ncbi:NAD(P)-dependent oxidoreductase [Halobacteriales archaeon QS_4_66_20]|nr:MAG: NAD(P)-dependent oxidoreductase [Halobacteriales archaeon QS_4_66_20]